MKYDIGFIGLGHMGFPMASNLLKSNITNKLYVYDLAQEPVSLIEKSGAIAAKNIAELAGNCDVIFTMLQTGQQVSSICLGIDGLFKYAKKNLLYIDCSSIDIETCKTLHKHAKSNNIRMLDAPVSGGVKGAAAASLTIMIGGEKTVLEDAKIILDQLGKNIIYAGHDGAGQGAKICNNMILGASMIAVSEAFNLGEKLGVDPQNLFNIISKGSGECWSLTKYCPYPNILSEVPSSNNYQPGFTAQMMLKDLNLSQEAANNAGIKTPMGALAKKLYSELVASDPNIDFSAVINFLHTLN